MALDVQDFMMIYHWATGSGGETAELNVVNFLREGGK